MWKLNDLVPTQDFTGVGINVLFGYEEMWCPYNVATYIVSSETMSLFSTCKISIFVKNITRATTSPRRQRE